MKDRDAARSKCGIETRCIRVYYQGVSDFSPPEIALLNSRSLSVFHILQLARTRLLDLTQCRNLRCIGPDMTVNVEENKTAAMMVTLKSCYLTMLRGMIETLGADIRVLLKNVERWRAG